MLLSKSVEIRQSETASQPTIRRSRTCVFTQPPLIPGAEVAVVFGDLDKKGGSYVIRIRSKGEVKVPPHWHVTDEHITVLEGSIWIGHGEQFDASKLQEMKVGAHAIMPAGVRHFSLTKADNVIELFGEAPFVGNFVNPEDDPRKAKSK